MLKILTFDSSSKWSHGSLFLPYPILSSSLNICWWSHEFLGWKEKRNQSHSRLLVGLLSSIPFDSWFTFPLELVAVPPFELGKKPSWKFGVLLFWFPFWLLTKLWWKCYEICLEVSIWFTWWLFVLLPSWCSKWWKDMCKSCCCWSQLLLW